MLPTQLQLRALNLRTVAADVRRRKRLLLIGVRLVTSAATVGRLMRRAETTQY